MTRRPASAWTCPPWRRTERRACRQSCWRVPIPAHLPRELCHSSSTAETCRGSLVSQTSQAVFCGTLRRDPQRSCLAVAVAIQEKQQPARPRPRLSSRNLHVGCRRGAQPAPGVTASRERWLRHRPPLQAERQSSPPPVLHQVNLDLPAGCSACAERSSAWHLPRLGQTCPCSCCDSQGLCKGALVLQQHRQITPLPELLRFSFRLLKTCP